MSRHLFSGHPTVSNFYTKIAQGILNLGFPITVIFSLIPCYISSIPVSSHLTCTLLQFAYQLSAHITSCQNLLLPPLPSWSIVLFLPPCCTQFHYTSPFRGNFDRCGACLLLAYDCVSINVLESIQILKILKIHEYSKCFFNNIFECWWIESTPTPYINSKHNDLCW